MKRRKVSNYVVVEELTDGGMIARYADDYKSPSLGIKPESRRERKISSLRSLKDLL